MHQFSTLKKMNSYLCVIDTLKFRTRFLIMRHTITRALARTLGIRSSARTCDRRYVRTYVYVSTRCHIQKVPQLPKWPLLQLTTSTYIGSSAMLHTWLPCIPADLVPDHWRNPGNCSRAGQHARSLRCGGVGGGYVLCGYLSVFRTRHGYDRLRILWQVYASQILIMRHRAPCRILIYASPFKNNYFSGDA